MSKIVKFFEQVKMEMGKVSWSTREELINSTIIVLIATFILGIYIGICDVVLSRVVNFLIGGVF
ncbi:SecE subunit of protein translocation complex [Candidatus Omnitrophus magneticus]|uniref:Protein translocase subunit SecE n=1 Tax=Candidatus Omnitrophus magneticus TaxID=1609969 RepID=A0A0F0CNG1_9BACT|nr:SecE subunit of protein translocation complex [Candidatus Omnitrophus magneticus]